LPRYRQLRSDLSRQNLFGVGFRLQATGPGLFGEFVRDNDLDFHYRTLTHSNRNEASTIGRSEPANAVSTSVGGDHDGSTNAIRVGLVTGLVTGAGTTLRPLIERYADNLPERMLGAVGTGLIL